MNKEDADGKLLSAYRSWLAYNGTTKEKLYVSCKAFVEDYASKLSGRVRRNYDDVVSVASYNLFNRLVDRSLHEDGFLPTVHAIMTKEISKAAKTADKGLAPAGYMPSYGHMPTARDAELRMFLDELDGDMHLWVMERIRFTGRTRDACLYVLDMELQRKYPSPVVLRDSYGAQNPSFIRDYVTVMCRRFLYETLKEHGSFIFRSNVGYLANADFTEVNDDQDE